MSKNYGSVDQLGNVIFEDLDAEAPYDSEQYPAYPEILIRITS
jgi:hypothetical protein